MENPTTDDVVANAFDVLDNIVPTTDTNSMKDPITETSPTTPTPTGGTGFKSDEPVLPLEPDRTVFKKHNRTFMVEGQDVPAEKIEKLTAVLDKLHTQGFTLRSSADRMNELDKDVSSKFARKEYYLPWKKFAPDVDAKVEKPNDKARRVSCWLRMTIMRKSDPSVFNDLTGVVRTFISRNTQLILGEDLETPVNFIIVYTPGGEEGDQRVDFKTAKNASYFIQAANILTIPVFNIQNDDAIDRLEKFLSIFN